MKSQIVIFTDLDGTLLDHNNYSYSAAEPALNYIRQHNIPLIFITSKTAVEILGLCKQSNFYHPFVAENGGLIAIPENYFSDKNVTREFKYKIIGITREDITLTLNKLTSTYKFRSFRDMSLKELMENTGLQSDQARYANERACTEPILWSDTPEKLLDFSKELERHNLTLIRGGRFHHVMGHHDKASAMLALIEIFESNWSAKITSIALGDSPNDLKMLQTAQHGIVIPNPHAPKMCVDNHANVTTAEHPAPLGWNDSLLTLFKELI